MARAARELQGLSACSVKSAEWSLSDGLLYFQGKIYVPDTSNLRRQIIALSHDSRLAGHSGRWKTLELVSQNYWWPQMSRYVGRYISTCDMCLWTKSFHHPLTRELHPLPIPSAPWDTVKIKIASNAYQFCLTSGEKGGGKWMGGYICSSYLNT